jgi:hypothetical protein
MTQDLKKQWSETDAMIDAVRSARDAVHRSQAAAEEARQQADRSRAAADVSRRYTEIITSKGGELAANLAKIESDVSQGQAADKRIEGRLDGIVLRSSMFGAGFGMVSALIGTLIFMPQLPVLQPVAAPAPQIIYQQVPAPVAAPVPVVKAAPAAVIKAQQVRRAK